MKEEKGVSIEELDNFRKGVIDYIHENADKIHCDEEYKTRIIIMTYELADRIKGIIITKEHGKKDE